MADSDSDVVLLEVIESPKSPKSPTKRKKREKERKHNLQDEPLSVSRKRRRLNKNDKLNNNKDCNHNHNHTENRNNSHNGDPLNNRCKFIANPPSKPCKPVEIEPNVINNIHHDLQRLSEYIAHKPIYSNRNNNNDTNKQILELQHELEQERKKNAQFLLIMKGLRYRVIQGSEPLFKTIKMYKKDIRYSRFINNIKQKVMNQHNNIDSMDIVIKNAEDYSHSTVKNLKKAIEIYLDRNSLDETKPRITIKKQIFDYNEVMKEYYIDNHERMKELNGQKGLMPKIKIPKNVCLGQYVGIYYSSDEYKKVFDHSNQWALRNQYAFDQMVKVPMDTEDGYKDITIVIDGFGIKNLKNESHHMLYINDCRLDINIERPTENDALHQNIEFVSTTIDEWPVIFIISCKDIIVGQELLGWYGTNFGDAIKDKNEYDKFKDYIRTLMDEQILKSVKSELSNDHWHID